MDKDTSVSKKQNKKNKEAVVVDRNNLRCYIEQTAAQKLKYYVGATEGEIS
jgi:hypothetical protein